jgi:hypothetical protein
VCPNGSVSATVWIAANITARCFFAAAIFDAASIRVTGETQQYEGRHFCPTCGSSVFARTGDEVELHLGALDQPDVFTPTYEIWTDRRESWLPPFAELQQYPREND